MLPTRCPMCGEATDDPVAFRDHLDAVHHLTDDPGTDTVRSLEELARLAAEAALAANDAATAVATRPPKTPPPVASGAPLLTATTQASAPKPEAPAKKRRWRDLLGKPGTPGPDGHSAPPERQPEPPPAPARPAQQDNRATTPPVPQEAAAVEPSVKTAPAPPLEAAATPPTPQPAPPPPPPPAQLKRAPAPERADRARPAPKPPRSREPSAPAEWLKKLRAWRDGHLRFPARATAAEGYPPGRYPLALRFGDIALYVPGLVMVLAGVARASLAFGAIGAAVVVVAMLLPVIHRRAAAPAPGPSATKAP